MIFMLILSALIGYLLGSVNSSLVIGKLFYKKDVRKFGSGNAGATNTLRILGKSAALSVVTGDILKGILACLIGLYLVGETSPGVYVGEYIAGLFAVIGHNWPVYFGFKGGKGVLTSLSVALMFSPLAALVCLVAFIVILALTRFVSLGSVVCAVIFAPAAYLFGGSIYTVLAGAILALFIVFRHLPNIKRLISGNETKISFRSKSAEEKV